MKKIRRGISLLITASLCLVLAACGNSGAAVSSGDGSDSSGASGSPRNRLEEILERGYIEVATEPLFAPFEFTDPTKTGDAQYVGSDIEFAKYIAAELGVELKIYPLEFSAVLAGISEGKYDLAISALAYTPARTQAMILSDGYFFSKTSAGHGLVIRTADKDKIKGPADLKGLTLAVQSGSLQEMFVSQQLEGLGQIKPVTDSTAIYLMVQEGKADVCAASLATAGLYIENNPNAGLMIVEGFKFTQTAATDGTRIGIPLGEDELAARINEIVKKVLASGEYETWYAEATEYARKLGV